MHLRGMVVRESSEHVPNHDCELVERDDLVFTVEFLYWEVKWVFSGFDLLEA